MRSTALKLSLIPVLMFGFGFALVPLYDVFCDITGINGKTGRVEASMIDASRVDTSRTIESPMLAVIVSLDALISADRIRKNNSVLNNLSSKGRCSS